MFAQFLARIYFEINGCIIGEFSTLKVISATNSKVFRNTFLAKLEKLFVVAANTFDNVKGFFPIGFFIWDTKKKEIFSEITADVFNENGVFTDTKNIYSYDNEKGRINDWLKIHKINSTTFYGVMMGDAPDFQNNNYVSILNNVGKRHGIYFNINDTNINIVSIYFSVRHCIEATWLNDRDQFLYPNDGWEKDLEFQNDCLAFTLFHGQNKITSSEGVNHWIPFTESEVNAKEKFESNFLTDFIKGKIKPAPKNEGLFAEESTNTEIKPLQFSEEATEVFNAGRELWKYYHTQKDVNVNASLYDIREYFQGRNDKGRMNAKSTDEKYTALIGNLRQKLNLLADKITPKVYEYEFLKQ